LIRNLLDFLLSGSSRFLIEHQRPYNRYSMGTWERRKAVNAYYRWESQATEAKQKLLAWKLSFKKSFFYYKW